MRGRSTTSSIVLAANPGSSCEGGGEKWPLIPRVLQRDWRETLTRDTRIRSRLTREDSGQAIAEFSLVVFLLVLVLFSILEVGLLLNDKMVLMSAAREVARVCAVEGGKTQNALSRLRELLTADGIDPDTVTASIRPTQAIYGTAIYVDLSYDYPVKSPVVRPLSGSFIPVSAHAVTRSEFVPR